MLIFSPLLVTVVSSSFFSFRFRFSLPLTLAPLAHLAFFSSASIQSSSSFLSSTGVRIFSTGAGFSSSPTRGVPTCVAASVPVCVAGFVTPSSPSSAASEDAVSFAADHSEVAVLDSQDQPAAAFSFTSFCRLGSFSFARTLLIPDSSDFETPWPSDERVFVRLRVRRRERRLVGAPGTARLRRLVAVAAGGNRRRAHRLRAQASGAELLLQTLFRFCAQTELALNGVFFALVAEGEGKKQDKLLVVVADHFLGGELRWGLATLDLRLDAR